MKPLALAAALAAMAALAGAEAQAAPRSEPAEAQIIVTTKPRAVVELFTSPYCASCPEADALFVKLAREPDLITLVMPVDSAGRESGPTQVFNERQAGYAGVRHQDYSYTPQAMINGTLDADGTDASEIGSAVNKAASLLSVPVTAEIAGGELVVTVGEGKAKSAATITVMPYLSSRTIAMRREKLTYANLVGDIVKLGTWSGKPMRQTLALDKFAPYDGIVVLVQGGTLDRPGAIIGAARLPLRAGSPAERADAAAPYAHP
jgi:hypothetical protein